MTNTQPVTMHFGATENAKLLDVLNSGSRSIRVPFGIGAILVTLLALWEPSTWWIAAPIVVGFLVALAVPRLFRAMAVKKLGDRVSELQLSDTGISVREKGVAVSFDWESFESWSYNDTILGLWASDRFAVPVVRSQVGPEFESTILRSLSQHSIGQRNSETKDFRGHEVFVALIALISVVMSILAAPLGDSREQISSPLDGCNSQGSVRVIGLESFASEYGDGTVIICK